MSAIKMTGHTNPTAEEGNSALHSLSHLPGFIFGYVDPKEYRVVSFHEDTHPSSKLVRTQVRVQFSLPKK